jgi:hypothetical protein
MVCEKHNRPLISICGDLLCAICFAESMEAEKVIAKRPEEKLTFTHRQFKRKER